MAPTGAVVIRPDLIIPTPKDKEPPPGKKDKDPPPDSPLKDPPPQEEDKEPPKSPNGLSFPDAILGDPGATHLSPSFSVSPQTDWSIPGNFNVLGHLTTGSDCCVIGHVDTVRFDGSNGFGLGWRAGGWQVSLTGFKDVRGVATTMVEICSENAPNYLESAEISFELEWWLAFMCRRSVCDARIGPLRGSAGVVGGLFGSSIHVQDGGSATSQFDIDAKILSGGVVGGAFMNMACSIGSLEAQASMDYLIGGYSSGGLPRDAVLFSVGLGFQF